METRISLSITVADDTGKGKVKVFVSTWDESILMASAKPYDADMYVLELDPAHSVYPYAMTALREASDRAIADMMSKFAAGEVLLMVEANKRQD